MIKIEGIIKERRPDGSYFVTVSNNEKQIDIICYISGRWKYKYRRVKLIVGDKVLVELNPYEKGKGKIIRKLR